MTFFLLVTVAVAAILALRARSRRDLAEVDWLPTELRGATLVWSEKEFRCFEPVPMVARIDCAYRGHDGRLTLIEFKRRATCRACPSDAVELSVQRYVLQRTGHAVNRHAYVAIVPRGRGPTRAVPVDLEEARNVERRAARLLAVYQQRMHPNGPTHPAVCQGCGHRNVCPHRVSSRSDRVT
jgi:CRISPR/Cas system-associated exonuclease Cas4 (RecB family)